MRMAKLRVTRISHLALLQRATVMKRSISRNAGMFPLAADEMPELVAALTSFATARNEVARLKIELQKWEAASRSCRKELEQRMSLVADNVSRVANGKTGVIHAAGMPATRVRRPVYLKKVQNLRVMPSAKEGELLARWEPVHRKCCYEVQVCTAHTPLTEAWKLKQVRTKSWCSLNTDLQSGQRVWVRVRAVGANGHGAWSNPVRKTVP